MMFNHVFKKTATERQDNSSDVRPEVPDGILKRCNACKSAVFVEDVRKNHNVCPHCHNYFRMNAHSRLRMIVDKDSFTEWDMGITSNNPLNFKNYPEKLESLKEKTGLDEAVMTGTAKIHGIPVALGVCDGRFMMASMGEVVGEKITRAVERATNEQLPVILVACSGGARMQEGIVSLMQMAKTAAALKRHSDAGLLYISILTDPTTGGVTASFAMLGDIILAEPGALIGFAGPRVIEQTIGQKLPKGFQRSEFLMEHGFIDQIVERGKMRETLYQILMLHQRKDTQEIFGETVESYADHDEDLSSVEMDAWEHVKLARDKSRPSGKDYISLLFSDFIELHGDRDFGDDPAVVGGIASFQGIPVTVITQEKGCGTKDTIYRKFGMVSPEGYHKSMRLMKQAEKFGRPVILFVDTPGAFCGIEAEERGEGEAIARNIYELSGLKVPVLSIVIGEGGSGGALAFAVADEVWMMEHAVYSVLSPEGFASILWKDGKRAKEAAQVMKLTSYDLKNLGIIEHIIGEKKPLTRENIPDTAKKLESYIMKFIHRYGQMNIDELVENRYQRFRQF